jgi:Uma2 family endonuclease
MSKVENGEATWLGPRYCPPGNLPIVADGMPVMYEDDGQEEMGDADIHTRTVANLFYGLKAYFASQPRYEVFSNLNLYYNPRRRRAYVSPDVMVTLPNHPPPNLLTSYRIGEEGPAPVFTAEVLSPRSYQQSDRRRKPRIYAGLGIREYFLVDVTGEFLPERLLLRQLQPDRTWQDGQDEDGGVTSRLGFRVVVESDGQLRIVDAKTGERYARPDEAQAMADRVRVLEEELARLRGTSPKAAEGKGRRRKP